MEKKCNFCKKEIVRRQNERSGQWGKRKYCSIRCAIDARPPSHYLHKRPMTDETRKKISDAQRGSKHNNWVENNPSYTSVHKWLSRYFSKTPCEKCGSTRFVEWALKKNRQHTHDRNNYLCLCSHCHKIYDYTEERKRKMSEKMMGRKFTKEWRDKIAKSNTGKKLSEAHKKAVSDYQLNNPRPRNEKGQFYKAKSSA